MRAVLQCIIWCEQCCSALFRFRTIIAFSALSFHVGGSVGSILHERGEYSQMHNNLLHYFDVDFRNVQKKFVTIYVGNFWKITWSLKLSSVYLLIVLFVFVRRNLSRSLRDLKSFAVFIDFFFFALIDRFVV